MISFRKLCEATKPISSRFLSEALRLCISPNLPIEILKFRYYPAFGLLLLFQLTIKGIFIFFIGLLQCFISSNQPLTL